MIYMLCCDRDPFAAHRHQMRSLFGSFGMDPFPLTPQIQHPRTRIQVRATKTGPVWTVISENDTESVHIFSPTLYSHKLEPWPPLAWWEWYDTVPCSPFCSDSLCILCFNGNKYILSVCTKKLTNLISGRNGAVSKKNFMWVRFCFVFFSGWRFHGYVQHDEWDDGEHGEFHGSHNSEILKHWFSITRTRLPFVDCKGALSFAAFELE